MDLPATFKHEANLVAAVSGLSQIGLNRSLVEGQAAEVENMAKLIADLKSSFVALDEAVEKAENDNFDKKSRSARIQRVRCDEQSPGSL